MTQQSIINATVQVLNQLPPAKVEAVSAFAQFLSKKHEEEMLTKGIQKLTEENPSFHFLHEDEDIYTIKDVKER